MDSTPATSDLPTPCLLPFAKQWFVCHLWLVCHPSHLVCQSSPPEHRHFVEPRYQHHIRKRWQELEHYGWKRIQQQDKMDQHMVCGRDCRMSTGCNRSSSLNNPWVRMRELVTPSGRNNCVTASRCYTCRDARAESSPKFCLA